MTKTAEVSLAPGVEGPVVGDGGRMSISGGNENDNFSGKRSQDLLRNLLRDRVAMTQFAVVA